MTRRKKGFQAGDPKPLDFDRDKDHPQQPFMTEADARGDILKQLEKSAFGHRQSLELDRL